jgi:hypothetical protein
MPALKDRPDYYKESTLKGAINALATKLELALACFPCLGQPGALAPEQYNIYRIITPSKSGGKPTALQKDAVSRL